MLCLCLFHVMPCWLILILLYLYHRTTCFPLSVRAIIIMLNERTHSASATMITAMAMTYMAVPRTVIAAAETSARNRMCVYKLKLKTAEVPDGPYAEAEAPGCTHKFNDAPYLGCFAGKSTVPRCHAFVVMRCKLLDEGRNGTGISSRFGKSLQRMS